MIIKTSSEIIESFRENKKEWDIPKSVTGVYDTSQAVITFQATVSTDMKKSYDDNDFVFKTLMLLVSINSNVLSFGTQVNGLETNSIMYFKDYNTIKSLINNKICRSAVIGCMNYYDKYYIEVLSWPNRDILEIVKSETAITSSLAKSFFGNDCEKAEICIKKPVKSDKGNGEKIDFSLRIINLRNKAAKKIQVDVSTL